MGDKLGDKKEDQLRDKLGDKGDKTAGRRTYHPTQNVTGTYGERVGNKGKQDLGKWDTPSNTGVYMGNNGRQNETRPREGRHNIQHKHTYGKQWDTGHGEIRSLEGGYNLKQKHHPIQAHM